MGKINQYLTTTKREPYVGLIQGLHPANERRCYKVTPSLIGYVQTLKSMPISWDVL